MPLLAEGICPQFTYSMLEQCKAIGIRTVADFVLNDPEDLAMKIKVPYKDIIGIQRLLMIDYASFPQSADSLYNEYIETMSLLSTGSKRVDKFLLGGIYSGEVTEAHGPPGSGKSQFCFSILSNLICKTKNTVLYLDSGSNFNAKRIEQILMKKLNEAETVPDKLKNVRIVNVYDIYNLFDCLDDIKRKLSEKEDHFYKYLKVLIIDSITPLLAPCFGGKILDGPGLMNNVAQQFRTLCCEHMLSIIVCNNTVKDKNCSIKPALGPNWKYVPSVSLCLHKVNATNLRRMTAVKSCRRDLGEEVMFNISEAGVCD
ncbi:DNA repair protein RAD51 homolog 4-like isoform X1 [Stegodyphus dumicola]|uniref:DNA repair protein RAD51 homolog 4-like isoform X1 n=2 Tax=Stegodyphus dumicola TaxID=202533 RepID=UPI0015A76139|nr:DNA repair protein RAD51 homolog 4-like isoform X1 [Stegodyphus dumicola]XP_035212185.1 DNA repair protein RAD51 homolog 4-like isoform X1 [Stegodyphus dumicola]